jgi:hypothetical protein
MASLDTSGDYGTPIPQGGVLLKNPSTIDQLLPNRFRLMLKRAPNVEFWVQQIVIPGFSIPSANQPNPFVDIPKSGEHIDYEDLGLSMLVDANLANYLEVYTWLRALGKPQSFDQYAALLEAPKIMDAGITSDVVVFLLNGAQQAKFKFTFHDAFPFALGSLTLDSTDPELQRVTCHVGFKYTYFDLEPVT